MTPLRRLGNKAFVMMTNLLFRSQFTDITYGYNAIWRHHRDKLAMEDRPGWAHEVVGNIRVKRHGLRVVEVASWESPRVAGVAKLGTFSAGWAILLAIIVERFQPLEPAGVASAHPIVTAPRLLVALPIFQSSTVIADALPELEERTPTLLPVDGLMAVDGLVPAEALVSADAGLSASA